MDEKWKKLTSKTKLVKLTEDITVELRALSFQELGELAPLQEKNDKVGVMNLLLFTSLRKAVPVVDMNDDELKEFIKTLDIEVAGLILNTIQELSGFTEKPKN